MKIFFCYHENDTMSTDAASGIRKAGFDLTELRINDSTTCLSDDEMLIHVLRSKADVYFTINQFNLVNRHKMLRALAHLGIKIAVWFIDNPFYFFPFLQQLEKTSNVYVFQWDRFYLEELKQFGFNKVYYLPQATNPDRFMISHSSSEEGKIFYSPLSYAANLDFHRTVVLSKLWLKETQHSDKEYFAILEELVMELLGSSLKPTHLIVRNYLQKKQLALEENVIYMLAEAVEHRASQILRIEYMNSLSSFNLRIWGEKKDWEISRVKAELAGRVSYFKNIPKVYRYSDINLNISRIQQRCGTNQRVFDVPAGGNFVISDYKEELEELFNIDSEIIVFRTPAELVKKIIYFQDPAKREQVIIKGQERVLKSHTYYHRMKEMVDVLSREESQQNSEDIEIEEYITDLRSKHNLI